MVQTRLDFPPPLSPMQFKMHEGSLFARLLRSPWWVSLAIGVVLGVAGLALLPTEYKVVGAAWSLPFLIIAGIAFTKQWNKPSASRVAAVLGVAQAMHWKQFSAALEAAFARDGFAVKRLDLPAADFELAKGGRTALVSARRWKAATQGVAPLEELAALAAARQADETLYVSIAPLTEQAQRLAADRRMRVVNGADLVQFLGDLPAGE